MIPTHLPQRVHALSLLALIGLVQGCTTPRTDPEPRMDRIETSLQSSPPAPVRVTPPAAVEAALLPPLSFSADLSRLAPSKQGGRFDINVHQAPAREFFMGLVQGTPYNMVVHPDVQGYIDLDLKGVTVDEVLNLVRGTYGYEYEKDGLNYIVLPPRPQTRMFQVNFLNVNRGGQSATQVSSGQINRSQPQAGVVGSGTQAMPQGNNPSSSFGSQIHTQAQTDYWRELAASLCTLVGLPLSQETMHPVGATALSIPLGCNEATNQTNPVNVPSANAVNNAPANVSSIRSMEGRSIVVSPQSGVVIARALPNELREIERYLKQSESNVQRQVILEAKLIEVELNDGFQSGINWSALRYWNGGNNGVLVGQTGGGTLLNGGKSEIAGNQGVLNPDARQLIESTTSSAFGGMFTATLALKDFTAFIELLKSQGNVQVLSSPRVSTLNNQKAVIKIGEDALYIVGLQQQAGGGSYNPVTGAAVASLPTPVFSPLFSGISLDVTPQISENEIILHIHPIVQEVTEQPKQFTLGNQNNMLPMAVTRVRESDSIVKARNGQVIVIGGLMEDAGKLNQANLPGLGDIPGLGELFKHRRNSSLKKELVILLKPTIVNGDTDWQQDIDTTRERIQHLRTIDRSSQPRPLE